MKIFVLSDGVLPTPHPKGHGLGRMVSLIASGLARRGHEVTLFGATGSTFADGRLITIDSNSYQEEVKMARAVIEFAHREQPDAILDNSHIHFISDMFPRLPVINVYHDNYQPYARCPVLLSTGQHALIVRQDTRFTNAVLIPNALPVEQFTPNYTPHDYVAWLGAVADIKQPILAIEACAKAGVKLVMAGMLTGAGALPITASSNVEYVGAIDQRQRDLLLSHARVYLQLGTVESFGLTTLEAGLLGTPTVGLPRGGTVDLIKDGANGVFVPPSGNQVNAIAEAIDRAWYLARQKVRTVAETLSDYEGMVTRYEWVCQMVARGEVW